MHCDYCYDVIYDDDFDVIRDGKRYCERCAEELGFIRYPHNDMCGCEQCAARFERD